MATNFLADGCFCLRNTIKSRVTAQCYRPSAFQCFVPNPMTTNTSCRTNSRTTNTIQLLKICSAAELSSANEVKTVFLNFRTKLQ